MASRNWKFYVSNLVLLVNIIVQSRAQDQYSVCTSLKTCGECIKGPNCGWCSQADFQGGNKTQLGRCNTTEGNIELGRHSCSPDFYFNPDTEINTITKRRLNNFDPISPHEISVKLRVGTPVNFTITDLNPKDYPLDLYFLMDLTATMRNDKDTLATLGNELAENLGYISREYRQGFGSFIDKETPPFATTDSPRSYPYALGEYIKPYGFRNHLPLSDPQMFNGAVERAKISRSFDPNEGGLDGLMQTLVCKEEIGWRDGARKILIFATDAEFHIAGDGKLGGIIRPNDGDCHLDRNGFYTHSTKLDYPSIAQLNHKVKQNNITVIFAVTKNQLEIYSKLASRIEGARVGIISKDHSNIVNVVVNEYQKIVTTIKLSDNLPKKYLKVKYFSKCANKNIDVGHERNVCENIRIFNSVRFTVSLELLKCPADKNEWAQMYSIYPIGVPYGLLIQLSLLCGCPCETFDNWVPKSESCSGVGTEKCGLCDCGKSYFGKSCECNATDVTSFEDSKACKAPESNDICSKRGQCYCNECICDRIPGESSKYTGSYCECDNLSCSRLNGNLCSGNGRCVCGYCECSPEWKGKDCSCSKDVKSCIKKGWETPCGGHGDCVCGNCHCKGNYSGTYCSTCKHESCPSKCEELAPCIKCKVFKSGLGSTDCDKACSSVSVDIVVKSDVMSDSDEHWCIHEDDTQNCKYFYSYQWTSETSVRVKAREGRECSLKPKPQILRMIIEIIGIILGIGNVGFLLYKIITFLLDRRRVLQRQAKNPSKDK